jgi:hypothetical protein
MKTKQKIMKVIRSDMSWYPEEKQILFANIWNQLEINAQKIMDSIDKHGVNINRCELILESSNTAIIDFFLNTDYVSFHILHELYVLGLKNPLISKHGREYRIRDFLSLKEEVKA